MITYIEPTFRESLEEFAARAKLTRAQAYRSWSNFLNATYADWKTRPAPVFKTPALTKQEDWDE